MSVAGQDINIMSDSAKLAEYIYIHMHYPLIDLVNNVEGTAVYKFDIDYTTGIKHIKIVKSSGSGSLDREGKRLLWQIPVQDNAYPTHEIAINFKLADNKIYDVSEVLDDMPEFPGGDMEMFQFISHNFNWPREADEMGIQGIIICGLVVEKDGSINIIEVVSPLQHWFDAEAIRVIKRMPKWKVGKKEGKPVRTYIIIPIKIQAQF